MSFLCNKSTSLKPFSSTPIDARYIFAILAKQHKSSSGAYVALRAKIYLAPTRVEKKGIVRARSIQVCTVFAKNLKVGYKMILKQSVQCSPSKALVSASGSGSASIFLGL